MTPGERATLLLLIASLGWTAWDMSRIGQGSAAVPSPSPARSAAPPVLPDDAYAEIVSRSLFVPSRRADFASARDDRSAIAGYVLRGVVLGLTDDSAMFEPLRGGAALRLRTGAAIGGYRIVAMNPDHVLLERDGKRRRLDIDDSAPSLDLAGVPADSAYAAGPAGVGSAPPDGGSALPPVILQRTEDDNEQ